MSNLKSTEKLLSESIKNIEQDRQVAKSLLADLVSIVSLNNDADTHRKLGEIAAKYLETMQRSNEQLVKLAALSAKIKSTPSSLSKEDISLLYDEVNNKEDKDGES